MKIAEVLKELKQIQNLIGENTDEFWQNNLEYTVSCVITEDADNEHEGEGEFIEYNGWGDKLDSLIEKLESEL